MQKKEYLRLLFLCVQTILQKFWLAKISWLENKHVQETHYRNHRWKFQIKNVNFSFANNKSRQEINFLHFKYVRIHV